MTDRTRVAVLGAGFIADIHLESLHRFVPEAEVTAIYSRSATRAEAMARKYGIPRWFTEVDELVFGFGPPTAPVAAAAVVAGGRPCRGQARPAGLLVRPRHSSGCG